MEEPTTDTNASDPKLGFYDDTFDTLHFHFLHCFEAGLRVIMRDDNEEMEEEEKASNDEYFDAQFARINHRIIQRHGNTASFDRFARKNNKFNIANEREHHTNTNSTYLDDVVKHLISARV
eukprot:767328_1